MPSQAKTQANRANARRSTGPRSAQGKQQSSQNALRHGFAARHLVIPPEEQEQFDRLADSLRREIQPCGCLEDNLFARFLHNAWNLYRLRRCEEDLAHGGQPFGDLPLADAIELLIRYKRETSRDYDRSLAQLSAQQNRRLALQHLGHTIVTGGRPLSILTDARAIQHAIQDAIRTQSLPGWPMPQPPESPPRPRAAAPQPPPAEPAAEAGPAPEPEPQAAAAAEGAQPAGSEIPKRTQTGANSNLLNEIDRFLERFESPPGPGPGSPEDP